MSIPSPLVPDYADRCTSNVIPGLLKAIKGESAPSWMASVVGSARRAVLMVIDGLGWDQLTERHHLAPTLASMAGEAITTTIPSTTPACLTSIVTGRTPAEHGIAGFRVSVGYKQVMDVKRWTIDGFDARQQVPPASFQTQPPFRGADVPAVIRAAFIGGALTSAQFHDSRLIGYETPSSIPNQVRKLLDGGDRLVYAYYDGLDVVAHISGLGAEYETELSHVDRLVADVRAVLPTDTALVVTADHGHVQLTNGYVNIAPSIVDRCSYLSGEARFRWLHMQESSRNDVLKMCHELYDDIAWVRTADEAIEENWFGGVPSTEIRRRLGDIVIAAHAPVGFLEPMSTSTHLLSRHGSLTSAEVNVPLIGLVA